MVNNIEKLYSSSGALKRMGVSILELKSGADFSSGRDYLWGVFEQIAAKLGAISPMDGVYRLRKMLVELNMELPETDNPDDYDKLVDAVNVLRLGNNPVELDKTALREIYDSVVRLKRG